MHSIHIKYVDLTWSTNITVFVCCPNTVYRKLGIIIFETFMQATMHDVTKLTDEKNSVLPLMIETSVL